MPAAAVFDQDSYRARNDDGSETAATWKAAANTSWTQAMDENFRVRVLIQETSSNAFNNFGEKWQFNHNSGGWTDIAASGTAVIYATSTHFANEDDTTQQLGLGTFITDNNGMLEGTHTGNGGIPDFAGSDETEFEIVVQLNSAVVSGGDTVEMRIIERDPMDTYTNTPSMTAQSPPGDEIYLRRYEHTKAPNTLLRM